MGEGLLQVPVRCPVCGSESLAKFEIGSVASSLVNHKPVQLYSSCHRVRWDADDIEREQVREYILASFYAEKEG